MFASTLRGHTRHRPLKNPRDCSVGRFLMLKESTFSGLLGKE
jgi:hypothetical protein